MSKLPPNLNFSKKLSTLGSRFTIDVTPHRYDVMLWSVFCTFACCFFFKMPKKSMPCITHLNNEDDKRKIKLEGLTGKTRNSPKCINCNLPSYLQTFVYKSLSPVLCFDFSKLYVLGHSTISSVDLSADQF